MTQLTGATIAKAHSEGLHDFSGIELQGIDLSWLDLKNINLSSAKLEGAKLMGTNLAGADLRGADCTGAIMQDANLSEAVLIGSCCREARLAGANLNNAKLSHADFAGAYMSSALLVGADLSYAKLFASNLVRASLSGACLLKAILTEAYLAEAILTSANLVEASLVNANLSRAILVQANLSNADLTGANLDKANLRQTVFEGAALANLKDGVPRLRSGCRIDLASFIRSGWGTSRLADWHRAGAEIIDFERFPETVQRALIGTQEGLTLYFRTRLDRFDRVLVEGTIVGVLGKDTDCDIAEFRNGEDGAVVRLTARQRVDLEQVAEALYRKVWEEEQKLAQDDAQRDVQAEDRALVRIVNLLHNPQLREGLGGLRDRLDAMELHEPDESPVDSAALVHFNGGRIPRDKIEAASLRWRLRLRHDDHGGSQYEIGRPWRVLLHHAPEDAASADELRKHLSPLVREGLVVISAPLLPGTTIAQEEQRRLHESDVLLALVSADYWASDDCHAFLHQALQRPSGQLRVVPVLVRSTTLDGTRFIGLRPLPENGRAVAEWRNQDSAWASVANGLRLLVRSTL